MNCEEYEKRLIKFVGIDNWNRPIFRVLPKSYYLSDVNNLFNYETTEEQIQEFYKNKKLNDYLTYHGSKFDSEPMGYKLDYNFELIKED